MKPWLNKPWPESLNLLISSWKGGLVSLAKKTGIDHKTITRWVNGSWPRKKNVRDALKKVWGFTENELPEIVSRRRGQKNHSLPPGWKTPTDELYERLLERAGVAFGAERREGQKRVSVADRKKAHQEFLRTSRIIKKKYKLDRWLSEDVTYKLLLKYGRIGLSNVERICA